MTSARYRWAWFALAGLLAAAWLWTGRYEYQACDTDGCVAVNRWSGRVHFQPAADAGYDEAPPGSSMVLDEGTGNR